MPSPGARTDSRLASGSADNTARVWDASTGRELLTLTTHTGWVNAVAWQRTGRTLATCSSDSTVRLWDTTTGLEEFTFHGHSTPVWSVTWSPDGSQVASIGSYGVIKVWDSQSRPGITGPARASPGGDLRRVEPGWFSSGVRR